MLTWHISSSQLALPPSMSEPLTITIDRKVMLAALAIITGACVLGFELHERGYSWGSVVTDAVPSQSLSPLPPHWGSDAHAVNDDIMARIKADVMNSTKRRVSAMFEKVVVLGRSIDYIVYLFFFFSLSCA